MLAETGTDCLKGRLKLSRHRHIKLSYNRAQVGCSLRHICNLRREKLKTRVRFFILLRRIRITASQRLEASSQAINAASQSTQIRLLLF